MSPYRILLMLFILTIAPTLAADPSGAELTLRYEYSQPIRSRTLLDISLGETQLEVATWGSGLLLPTRQALRAPGFLAGPAAPSGLFAELLSPVASNGTSAVWAAPLGFSPDFSIAPVSRNVLAVTVDRTWSRVEATGTTALWQEREVRAGALALSLGTPMRGAASLRVSLLASRSDSTVAVAEETSERLDAGWFPGPMPPSSGSHALGSLELVSSGHGRTQASTGAAVGVSMGPVSVPGLWLRVGALLERDSGGPSLPTIVVPLYVALVSPAFVTGKLRSPSTDARAGIGVRVALERFTADIDLETDATWPSHARGMLPPLSLLGVDEISSSAGVAFTPEGLLRRLTLKVSRIDEILAGARTATSYALDGRIALQGSRGAFESTLGVGLTRDEGWEKGVSVAVGFSLRHPRHSWMPEWVEIGGRVRGELAIREDVALEITGSLTGRVRVKAPE